MELIIGVALAAVIGLLWLIASRIKAATYRVRELAEITAQGHGLGSDVWESARRRISTDDKVGKL